MDTIKNKSARRFLILTVEPLSNKGKSYRLGLMSFDFLELKTEIQLIESVKVKLGNSVGNITINDKSSLKTYKEFGKLVNPAISNWITTNGLQNTQKGHPCKLIFELKNNKKEHIYTIYNNQLNLICNNLT
jgi:hypothetical protein